VQLFAAFTALYSAIQSIANTLKAGQCYALGVGPFQLRVWFLALLVAGIPVEASALTLVEQDRGVFARSYVVHSPVFQEDVAAGEALAFEPFSVPLSSDASLTPSLAVAAANMQSTLSEQRIYASGGTDVAVDVPESDRHAEAPADSFFEVIFDIESEVAFMIEGNLDGQGTGGDAYASVELVELLGPAVVSESFSAGTGPASFVSYGSLPAGRYRLTALAVAHAGIEGTPGAPEGSASYDAVLFVPEPGGVAGGWAIAATVAVMARCRRSCARVLR
jgi:hypothetical protein